MSRVELTLFLAGWAKKSDLNAATAAVLARLAEAASALSERIADGPMGVDPAAVVGANEDGDAQKALDVEAHELFLEAIKRAPVSILYSEEAKDALPVNYGAPLVVAMDPLDG
mgnify:CR=1 FL=1